MRHAAGASAAALAAALAVAPADAHEPSPLATTFDPIYELDLTAQSRPGFGRVRLVADARRAALLTPDQYWEYARHYRTRLARLVMRMPVHDAVPHARAGALDHVIRRYAVRPAPRADLDRLLVTRARVAD